MCDDGIVIDLSAMRAVSVDLVDSTALVQGGALLSDVDHETQSHGLATTGGIVSHTLSQPPKLGPTHTYRAAGPGGSADELLGVLAADQEVAGSGGH